MTDVEIYRVLECYGTLWSGARATYSYRLPAGTDVTPANVRSYAGDFVDLLDWRLVDVTHEYVPAGRGLYHRGSRYRTARGFRNGMTPRRFYTLANRTL